MIPFPSFGMGGSAYGGSLREHSCCRQQEEAAPTLWGSWPASPAQGSPWPHFQVSKAQDQIQRHASWRCLSQQCASASTSVAPGTSQPRLIKGQWSSRRWNPHPILHGMSLWVNFGFLHCTSSTWQHVRSADSACKLGLQLSGPLDGRWVGVKHRCPTNYIKTFQCQNRTLVKFLKIYTYLKLRKFSHAPKNTVWCNFSAAKFLFVAFFRLISCTCSCSLACPQIKYEMLANYNRN